MDVGLLWPKDKEPAGLSDIFRQFLIHACDGDEVAVLGNTARKR
jgi:hypothetical protein